MALRIWLAALDDVDLAAARGSFSPEEMERAERMASPSLHRRFLARRWMARVLLAGETGGRPGGVVLERRCERCGELHPASPLSAEGKAVWWSATSSAGVAAVAVSDWRVGLDIEKSEPQPQWERIARRFYSEDERRAAAASPTRFLELWTLKEAYLKAIGLGLAGGLGSIDGTGLSSPSGGWSESAGHPGWRFRPLQLEPGFVAAVAVEGVPAGIEISRWPPPQRRGDAPREPDERSVRG